MPETTETQLGDRFSPSRLPVLDGKDRAIITRRMAAYDRDTRPRVGDWIRFADGPELRIGELARGENDWTFIQPAAAGTWHLGDAGVVFSGGYHSRLAEGAVLSETGATRDGDVWIFHHGVRAAHNGVDSRATFRVWAANVASPGYIATASPLMFPALSLEDAAGRVRSALGDAVADGTIDLPDGVTIKVRFEDDSISTSIDFYVRFPGADWSWSVLDPRYTAFEAPLRAALTTIACHHYMPDGKHRHVTVSFDYNRYHGDQR